MPGYVRGFVEREFASQWEFVCRVDPFTGSQGQFKYVLFGTDWASPLGPVVHTEGFPDDLAPATKLAMLGRPGDSLDRLSGSDLDEQFREFRTGSGHANHRHVSLAELLEFDWDRSISDEGRSELVEAEPRERTSAVRWLFELVDSTGTDYRDWERTDDWDWRTEFDQAATVDALLRGARVETGDRVVSLRPRSRREILPDTWFDLLELLSDDFVAGHRAVRFVFYWHH